MGKKFGVDRILYYGVENMTEEVKEISNMEIPLELVEYSQEDLERLADQSDEIVQLIREFEDEMDQKLEEFNGNPVLEELGVAVNIEANFNFKHEERWRLSKAPSAMNVPIRSDDLLELKNRTEKNILSTNVHVETIGFDRTKLVS